MSALRRIPIDLRGAVIAVLALLVFSAIAVPGWLDPFERLALDRAFLLRGPLEPETPIVIVAIDEGSFDELDLAWPWPRSLHGKVFEILRESGAIAIGVDLLFSEPSAWGKDDDASLQASLASAEVVVLAAGLTTVDEGGFVKTDLNPPIPDLRDAAAGFGPVNLTRDADAFVRTARLAHEHQDRPFPSFGARVLEVAAAAGYEVAPAPRDEAIVINFRGGPQTFPTVPYHRVARGEIALGALRDKIVLVGATSPALHDVFPTPFAGRGDMPGVEIHANLLETVIRGIALHRISRTAATGIALLAVLLSFALTDRFGFVRASVALIVAAILYEAGAFLAFTQASLWLDFAALPLALGMGLGSSSVVSFLREQREKRRLSRFFSPEVVSEIVRQRDEQALGSVRRTVTVLFCDIRGFTSISEKLPAEEVASLLREYLTEMTDAVFRHGGTVDKFVGDAVMALYNAPLERPTHAVDAVRTALEIQQRVRRLSPRWEAHGVALKNGVGIHTGEVIVGTLGSEQRLEYTAIGDAVNLASRLEGMTKELGTPIVVSGETYAAVEHVFPGQCLGEVAVKGKERPVEVYAIPLPVS